MGMLGVDQLRNAVEIYLGIAYPTGEIPQAVRKRLEWAESADLETILVGRPFERVVNPQGEGVPIFALRLGNASYPNMKLQVQPWAGPSGYLLSVNSHDHVPEAAILPAELERYRSLQVENQRIKSLVEEAWDGAGLPTFNRYLKDYLGENPVG
ncbi:MAG: hypothetical protein U0800_14910 [Isosphaeraceae bacterium]